MTAPAPLQFALNRTCAPQRELDGFLSLAAGTGVAAVEIRNDIEGREFANGMPADALRDRLEAAGLSVASVNALQRFNDWTPEREAEAREVIAYAAALGAPGLVLCPVIDESDPWGEGEAARQLRKGLKGLRPIFDDHGVTGYVEPLGMRGSTMKRQKHAVEAVDDIDGWASFRICHDTFQFFRCGDAEMFPARVGLVHVSGIARTDLAPDELTEPDRGFVFGGDRVGNLGQLRTLVEGGYEGFVSMEPFSPEVQTDPEIEARLSESLSWLVEGLTPAAGAAGLRH